MRFERTRDRELVRSVLTHPAVYGRVSDDFAPAAAEYEPPMDECIWWVAARDGDELLGVFMVYPHSHVCWEVHVAFLPSAWGPRAIAATRAAAQWLFGRTHCRRIVASIPASNRLAIRFARAAGMKQYGLNPRSWAKAGGLEDLVLLGISKGDE
jgi:RimJ/RimL family protein N-acetyltransferase